MRPRSPAAVDPRHSLPVRLAIAAAVLLAASAVGMVVGKWPMLALVAIPLSLGGLGGAWALSRQSLRVGAMMGLLAVHAITMTANFWILQPINTVTDLTRVATTGGLILGLGIAAGARFMRSPPRSTTLLVTAYATWAIIGGQFAVNPARSLLVGGSLLAMALVIGLVLSTWRDPAEAWATFLRGQIVIGSVICALCLAVSLAGVEEARNLRFAGQSLLPAFKGLFSNSILLGELGTLTAGSVLALLTLRSGEAFTPRRIAVVGLATVCLVSSGARSPLLGMMATAGAYWFFLERRRITPQTAVGLVIAGSMAAFLVIQLGALETTFQRLFATEVGDEGRLVIWATAFRVFFQSPITGQGFGTTSGQFGFMEARLVEDMSLHNAVLDYGLTAGVPGTLLFGALLIRCVLGILRTRDRRLAAALTVTFAGVLPISLTNTTMAVMSVMPWMFWFPLLFSSSLLDWTEGVEQRPLRGGATPSEPEGRRPPRRR